MAHMSLATARREATGIMAKSLTHALDQVGLRLVVQRGRHFVSRGQETLAFGHDWDECLSTLLMKQVVGACAKLGVEPPKDAAWADVCEKYMTGRLADYPAKVTAQPKDALHV